jgi:hypothetical protein
MIALFKRVISFFFLVMAGFYIFVIEEFIWNPAVFILRWARGSMMVLYVEEWMKAQQGGMAVLLLLVLPSVFIWPIKLLALYLFAHGYPVLGGSMFLGIKVVATALFAQLYTMLGDQCEKVTWFHYCANKVREVRRKVQSHILYQEAQQAISVLRSKVTFRKSVVKHRFLAALRYMRKQKT